MKALEHKVPPPIVVVLLGAAMGAAAYVLPMTSLVGNWRFAIAGVLGLIGAFFAVPAFIAFAHAKTTIDPINIEAASTLVTSGIYRYTRNPMYVGLTSLLLAWAFCLSVPWVFLGPVAFLIFITRFQIMPEERLMRTKFGRDYDDYRKRVRRWL
jgi:protein-S-isoprenylcysteine O-methyltransferase Ste14